MRQAPDGHASEDAGRSPGAALAEGMRRAPDPLSASGGLGAMLRAARGDAAPMVRPVLALVVAMLLLHAGTEFLRGGHRWLILAEVGVSLLCVGAAWLLPRFGLKRYLGSFLVLAVWGLCAVMMLGSGGRLIGSMVALPVVMGIAAILLSWRGVALVFAASIAQLLLLLWLTRQPIDFPIPGSAGSLSDAVTRFSIVMVLGMGIIGIALRVRLERLAEQADRAQAEAQEALQRAQASEERFRQFATLAADWFWELDAEDRITFVSDGYERFLGRSAADLIGRHPWDLPASEQRVAQIASNNFGPLRRREAFQGMRVERRAQDGSKRVLLYSGMPMHAADGRYLGFRGAVHDITETDRLTAELSYQASHDALTGLINRREFERRLSESVSAAAHGSSTALLLYVDLDNFKAINDRHGHARGDALLRAVAAVLAQEAGSAGYAARMGGDEFVLVMPGALVADGAESEALRQRLESAIAALVEGAQDSERRFGASVGIARIDGATGDVDQALAQADAACYAIKRRRRSERLATPPR